MIQEEFSTTQTNEMTPECIYDRGWALALLQEALCRLESELQTAGKGRRFEVLKPFLTGNLPAATITEACRSRR